MEKGIFYVYDMTADCDLKYFRSEYMIKIYNDGNCAFWGEKKNKLKIYFFITYRLRNLLFFHIFIAKYICSFVLLWIKKVKEFSFIFFI